MNTATVIRTNAKGIVKALLIALLVCAANAAAETVLLKNARVYTVAGAILPKADVLISGGKIERIAPEIDTAADATLDLSGQHLYPGLIATCTSLGLIEISAVQATIDSAELGEYTPDVHSWLAVNPDSELLPVARANGITHIVPVPGAVPGKTKLVSGFSGLVALDGWGMEERTVKGPVALHVFWPGMSLDTRPKEAFKNKDEWKSLEEQAKERQLRLKALDDFFADAEAYHQARAAEPVPAWEAMRPFVRGEVPMIIHADDYREIKAAVNWATARKYKVIIAGGKDAWQLADLLAKHRIPLVFERIFTGMGRFGTRGVLDTDFYDVHFKAPGILHKAGVKVIFGEGLGGSGASNIRNLPYSAAQATAFGLPEEEAIRGLTLYPAEALGVADKLGSIEAGKEATIIAVSGSILDIRSRVTHMWIAGRPVDLSSRHTRLYEKYRNRPRL